MWYFGHTVPINVPHLEARLAQTGHLPADTHLTIGDIRDRFRRRVADIDLDMAKQDVLPFVRDPFAMEVWSREFFESLAEKIVTTGAAGQ